MITHSEQWRNAQVSKLALRRKSLRLHVNRQFVYWRHPALVFLLSDFIKTKHFVLLTGWEITRQTKAKSGISSNEFLVQLMRFKVFELKQHHITETVNCTVLLVVLFLCQPSDQDVLEHITSFYYSCKNMLTVISKTGLQTQIKLLHTTQSRILFVFFFFFNWWAPPLFPVLPVVNPHPVK